MSTRITNVHIKVFHKCGQIRANAAQGDFRPRGGFPFQRPVRLCPKLSLPAPALSKPRVGPSAKVGPALSKPDALEVEFVQFDTSESPEVWVGGSQAGSDLEPKWPRMQREPPSSPEAQAQVWRTLRSTDLRVHLT